MNEVAELKAQITQIERDAANKKAELERRLKEVMSVRRVAVIQEMKKNIAEYNITGSELGIKSGKGQKTKEKKEPVVRFRNGDLTWSGRGPKADWVKPLSKEELEKFKVAK